MAGKLFMTMLQDANVTVITNAQVQTLTKSNSSHLHTLTAVDGRTFIAKVFVDASYEGDLLPLAGVPWAVGRVRRV